MLERAVTLRSKICLTNQGSIMLKIKKYGLTLRQSIKSL